MVLNLLEFVTATDGLALRGVAYTVLTLHFVLICQLILLQPLISALDGMPGNAAELFERIYESIKMKRYIEALDDLNTAIESEPSLSEAYLRRASVLRQLCRYEESERSYTKFLELKPGNSAARKELSQMSQA